MGAASAKVVEAIDQTEVAIMLVGPDHTVSYANLAAHELLGYEAGALAGLSLRWLSPPSRHGELKNIDDVFSGQSTRRIRSNALRSDGSRLEVALKLEPCWDAHGKVVAVSVSYEQIAPGSSINAGRPHSQQPTFAPTQPSMKPPPPPSQHARAASQSPGPRTQSHAAPRTTPTERPAPPPPPRTSNTAQPKSSAEPLSWVTASLSRSSSPASGSRPAVAAQATARPSPLPARPGSLPARPSALPAHPGSLPAQPGALARPASQAAPSAAQARPSSQAKRLDAPSAPALSSQRPLLGATVANQQVEAPRSGSQPIAVHSHRAGAPPQNEAFESLSERLESALQLMRWFEEKLSAPPGSSSLDEPRERARALVVFRDIQALVAESKVAADTEAGGVDIPRAPKMPHL